MLLTIHPHEESKRPEDASYTLDVLARCMVSREGEGKRTTRIVPLKDPGEPIVVSVPLSQVRSPLLISIVAPVRSFFRD